MWVDWKLTISAVAVMCLGAAGGAVMSIMRSDTQFESELLSAETGPDRVANVVTSPETGPAPSSEKPISAPVTSELSHTPALINGDVMSTPDAEPFSHSQLGETTHEDTSQEVLVKDEPTEMFGPEISEFIESAAHAGDVIIADPTSTSQPMTRLPAIIPDATPEQIAETLKNQGYSEISINFDQDVTRVFAERDGFATALTFASETGKLLSIDGITPEDGWPHLMTPE